MIIWTLSLRYTFIITFMNTLYIFSSLCTSPVKEHGSITRGRIQRQPHTSENIFQEYALRKREWLKCANAAFSSTVLISRIVQMCWCQYTRSSIVLIPLIWFKCADTSYSSTVLISHVVQLCWQYMQFNCADFTYSLSVLTCSWTVLISRIILLCLCVQFSCAYLTNWSFLV
jgi:hypothetical protein